MDGAGVVLLLVDEAAAICHAGILLPLVLPDATVLLDVGSGTGEEGVVGRRLRSRLLRDLSSFCNSSRTSPCCCLFRSIIYTTINEYLFPFSTSGTLAYLGYKFFQGIHFILHLSKLFLSCFISFLQVLQSCFETGDGCVDSVRLCRNGRQSLFRLILDFLERCLN